MKIEGWGRVLAPVFSLIALASCESVDSVSTGEQRFCPLLSAVASGMSAGEMRKIRLSSDRIGVPAEYTKNCEWFDGGAGAEELCDWWFHNSHNEFFGINVNEAADCLRAGTPLMHDLPDWIRLEAAQYKFEDPPRLGKDIVAELEFSLLADAENKSGGFVEVRLTRPR